MRSDLIRSAQDPRPDRPRYERLCPNPVRTVCLSAVLALCAVLSPLSAQAFSLEFPIPATPLGERRADLTSYRLPTGPFQQDGVPARLTEGNLDQTAWRLDAVGKTTLELLVPLRAQIAAAGWETLFACETQACGGFDFRYAIDVLPEPEMHVDLGDYRFLAARRDGPRGEEFLSLLVSRSADQGFVQMTLVGAEATPDLIASTKSPEDPLDGDVAAIAAQSGTQTIPQTVPLADLAAPDSAMPVAETVAANGAAPESLGAALSAGLPYALDDLVFAPGVARLSRGEYPSLGALAAWLQANPQATVTLVGHTDSRGGRAANTALSKKRAEAIRAELATRFGIDPARIAAEGAGPEFPRADNDTAEGREKNRWVEVVRTSTR